MKIIDAHMHLPVNFRVLGEKKKALLDEMKTNGVTGGVVISDSEITSDIGSMRECAELFSDRQNIAVVGGISPFIDYQNQLKLLEYYIVQHKLAGIKIFCGHEPIYINDTILKPVFDTAERFKVPVLFHSGWDNPRYSSPRVIKAAAEAYPNVKLICCHCCYPDLNECFNTLRDNRNVYFDTSSVASDNNRKLFSVLEEAIHSMPDRFIFGSDYNCCSQTEHITFFQSLDISGSEKEMLFFSNAEIIYGITGS